MSYRILADPHHGALSWRARDGWAQWKLWHVYGSASGPWCALATRPEYLPSLVQVEAARLGLFPLSHTPERVAVWTDLLLNPTTHEL